MTNLTTSKFFVIPINQSVEEFISEMQKATTRDINSAIALLFSGLARRQESDFDDEITLRAYEMVLSGFPGFAIESAVECFLRGQVPNASATFVPSTAELAAECRRQLGMRLRREPEPEEKPIEPITPERRKELSDRLRIVASQMKTDMGDY